MKISDLFQKRLQEEVKLRSYRTTHKQHEVSRKTLEMLAGSEVTVNCGIQIYVDDHPYYMPKGGPGSPGPRKEVIITGKLTKGQRLDHPLYLVLTKEIRLETNTGEIGKKWVTEEKTLLPGTHVPIMNPESIEVHTPPKKEKLLKPLLQLYTTDWQTAISCINLLRRLGIKWEEFKAIEKSVKTTRETHLSAEKKYAAERKRYKEMSRIQDLKAGVERTLKHYQPGSDEHDHLSKTISILGKKASELK